MNEIVDFLRNTTHLARLTISEVEEMLAKLETEGYSIVKKVEAESLSASPVALPPVEPVAQ